MAFQMMFAIITPALITGAFAERKRFKAFVLFAVAWATFVYAPIAHWVWSPDGWLFGLGVLDFAGGTVVHLSSGVAALVAALFIGRRAGLIEPSTEPHDVPMTVLGAGLLWFGWFGFNAGSALGANGLAATAFVTTNTAAAMAALTWVTLSWLHRGTPSVLGAAIGAIAGLVAITPAAGYVTPAASVLIGLGVGVICYGAALLRLRSRVDDALDVFSVHGVGGAVGALATGIFATTAVNAAGVDGLLAGNPGQLLVQALGVGVVAPVLGGRDRRDPLRRQPRRPDPRPRPGRGGRPRPRPARRDRLPVVAREDLTDGHRRPGRLRDPARRLGARARSPARGPRSRSFAWIPTSAAARGRLDRSAQISGLSGLPGWVRPGSRAEAPIRSAAVSTIVRLLRRIRP